MAWGRAVCHRKLEANPPEEEVLRRRGGLEAGVKVLPDDVMPHVITWLSW